MSRISALWTAGAVAVLFALLIGAVMLRPVLSVDAGDPASNNPATIVNGSQEQPAFEAEDHESDDEGEDHEDDHDDHEAGEDHEDDD